MFSQVILPLCLFTLVKCNRKVVNVMDAKHAYDVINDHIPHLTSNGDGGAEMDWDDINFESHKDEIEATIDLPPPPPTTRSPSYLPPVPPLPSSTSPSHISNIEMLKEVEDPPPKTEDKKLNDVLLDVHESRMRESADASPQQNLKVYNLVLNPEKHSWCEPKSIKHIVTHPNCHHKEMENFVCIGTCFSYSIPQTKPETPGDEMLDYCEACQSEHSQWTTVELDCEEDGRPYTVTKEIQTIANCSCSTCKPPRRTAMMEEAKKWRETIPASSEMLHNVLLTEAHYPSAGGSPDRSYKLYRDADAQMSLGQLKKEYGQNDKLDKLYDKFVYGAGKMLNIDTASFIDDDEEKEAVFN